MRHRIYLNNLLQNNKNTSMTWTQRNCRLIINSKATGWAATRSQKFFKQNIHLSLSLWTAVGGVMGIAISRAGAKDMNGRRKSFASRSLHATVVIPSSSLFLSPLLLRQSRVRKVARPLLLSAEVTFVGNGTSYSCYVERLRETFALDSAWK